MDMGLHRHRDFFILVPWILVEIRFENNGMCGMAASYIFFASVCRSDGNGEGMGWSIHVYYLDSYITLTCRFLFKYTKWLYLPLHIHIISATVSWCINLVFFFILFVFFLLLYSGHFGELICGNCFIF